jgi:hypothetical protein
VSEEDGKSVCLFGGRYGVLRVVGVEDGTEEV